MAWVAAFPERRRGHAAGLSRRAQHGWLYGRGLDKRRLTAWQRELGAALVIVASWVVEDYQVIRLAGSLTPRATRLAHEGGLDVAPLGKIPICAPRACW